MPNLTQVPTSTTLIIQLEFREVPTPIESALALYLAPTMEVSLNSGLPPMEVHIGRVFVKANTCILSTG